MAHFLTLVLVEPTEPDPEAQAYAVLRPYFNPEGSLLDPRFKYDGCVIGGRYDGLIWAKEERCHRSPSEYQKWYEFDVIRPADNIRPVADLPVEFIPFAVVTPDGEWREREGKSEREWEREFRALVGAHIRLLAVVVDCHC